MRLLVIIPALNEEKSLRALLDEFKLTQPTLPWITEAVVIDDGSTDRTAQVAAAANVRVVRLCRNLGIGAAVQTGLRLAHREGFDAALQMDGDGQHPPGEIARLLARLAAADAPDLVVGSRHIVRRGYQATGARRFGQLWLIFWLRLLCGLKLSDPTSGFRLYGAAALRLFEAAYPDDFPEPESLAIASKCGLLAVEEPVEMRARQGGQSSINGLKPIYYMIKVTLAVALSVARHSGARAATKRKAALEPETPDAR
ncbi:MAG TPA: glycosyltransferase family 2 protein [Polyangiaceae bacterium]|nr:glycosyltransferase family 2 protein [Polyangiaceae bacterium]